MLAWEATSSIPFSSKSKISKLRRRISNWILKMILIKRPRKFNTSIRLSSTRNRNIYKIQACRWMDFKLLQSSPRFSRDQPILAQRACNSRTSILKAKCFIRHLSFEAIILMKLNKNTRFKTKQFKIWILCHKATQSQPSARTLQLSPKTSNHSRLQRMTKIWAMTRKNQMEPPSSGIRIRKT